ncbi:MAG: carbonic anhydrase [Desulfobacteraceae bacterium]|nr:carbonic anhydrase [Desulfobacteraceae bacterium]
MSKCNILICALILMIAGCNRGVQWAHYGSRGPENWGSLDPEFSACSEGKNQSPVNLTKFTETKLPGITFYYQVGGFEIINKGHTIIVNQKPGSKIIVGGNEFELKQYYFRSPSEHNIDNVSFPLEAHLVHQDKNGNYAIIAIFFIAGEKNENISQAWANIPEQVGDRNKLSIKIDAETLVPDDRDYYYVNGSLTTPPCTEGVKWFIMKTPMTASIAQIEKFTFVIKHPNNRPLQPIHSRKILK